MQFTTIINCKKDVNSVVIKAIANSGVPNATDKAKESDIPTKIKNKNLIGFAIKFSIYFISLLSYLFANSLLRL